MTERAVTARQLRPRGDSIADMKSSDTASCFHDPRAKLMAEKLHGGFCFETPLNAVVCQGGDAIGKLRLGDARLNAERLHENMPRQTDRHGNLVETHVTEAVESPGFHRERSFG